MDFPTEFLRLAFNTLFAFDQGFRGYGAAAISGAPSPLKLADGAPHDAAERPEPVRHSL